MNIYDIIKWNKARFNPMSKTSTKKLLLSMMQDTQEMILKINSIKPSSEVNAANKEYLQLVNDKIASLLSYGRNVFFDNSHLTHTFTTKSFPNGKISAIIHDFNGVNFMSAVAKTKDGNYVYIKNSDKFGEVNSGNIIPSEASLSIDYSRAKRIISDYCYIADHPYGREFCIKAHSDSDKDKINKFYDVTQLRFLADTLCSMIEFAILTENYPEATHFCKIAEEISSQFIIQYGKTLSVFETKVFNRIAIYANVLFELDKARQDLLKDMRVESELE